MAGGEGSDTGAWVGGEVFSSGRLAGSSIAGDGYVGVRGREAGAGSAELVIFGGVNETPFAVDGCDKDWVVKGRVPTGLFATGDRAGEFRSG